MTSFINIDDSLWNTIKEEFLSCLSSFDKSVLKLVGLYNCVPETNIFIIFPTSLTPEERESLEVYNDDQLGLLKSRNTPEQSFTMTLDKTYIKCIQELYSA